MRAANKYQLSFGKIIRIKGSRYLLVRLFNNEGALGELIAKDLEEYGISGTRIIPSRKKNFNEFIPNKNEQVSNIVNKDIKATESKVVVPCQVRSRVNKYRQGLLDEETPNVPKKIYTLPG